MIDTIKIFTMIDFNTYNIIKSFSIQRIARSNSTGELLYDIVNDNIEGSYNSSLCVRVGNGSKYSFKNMCYIEIEGNYHKFLKGYNSHKEFYNLLQIALKLIKIAEDTYKIKLPSANHWLLQRCDIAICFNLRSQYNIGIYINNLGSCNYPRRKMKHYKEESIYLSGSTTSLKIYNKLAEFKKHDLKNFKDTNFNIPKYLEEIKGFIRYECEIKKRKLESIYNKKYIRINTVTYKDLKKVWTEEFEKFYKIIKNDLELTNDKEKIKSRLNTKFQKVRDNNLYNFYLLITIEGLEEIKRRTNKSMYYKNIADLKKCGIDFSQNLNLIETNNIIEFNPFTDKEIL